MMSKENQIEEMSCKKCLHYEMCLENFRKAKEEGLWELTEEDEYFAHADECDFCAIGYRKQSEWISVEERLPDIQQEVLTYSECNGVRSACLIVAQDDIKMWYLCKSDKFSISVTHWMPLPDPPKKDGAE